MSPSRRDFLKGIAAAAAAVPSIAVAHRFGPAECQVPIDPPSVLEPQPVAQRHGKQPDFTIMEYEVVHDCNVLERMGGQLPDILTSHRTSVHLNVFSEHAAELADWCRSNLLTVELPQIDARYELLVTEVSIAATGHRDENILMVIEGIARP